MGGPLSLKDWRSILDLQPHGVELDYMRARLWPHSALGAALAERIPFNEIGATTVVLYPNQGKNAPLGFVQARLRRNRPEADISYIAPALDARSESVTVWYRLLAELTNQLCEKGCQRIYVQMPSDSDVEQVFKQAGFTTYTREDLYLLPRERIQSYPRPIGPRLLRRQRSRDSWNLLRLYNAATPRPVQQAEFMVSSEGKLGKLGDWWDQSSSTGYILDGPDGGIVGAARITRGRAANWLRLYLHPSYPGEVGELVCGALSLINTAHPRPVYCGIREYEGGVRATLEEAGFEYQLKRSLMVKHATVRAKEPALWAVPALEKPTPMVHTRVHAKTRKEQAAVR